MQRPRLDHLPAERARLLLSTKQQRVFDATTPVLGEDEDVEIRARGLGRGVLEHAGTDDLAVLAHDEVALHVVGPVLPHREHLFRCAGKVRYPGLDQADSVVERDDREKVSGIGCLDGCRRVKFFQQGEGDVVHVRTFFQAPS